MTPDKYQAAIAAARACRKMDRIALHLNNHNSSDAEFHQWLKDWRENIAIIGRSQSILRLEIEQTGANFDDVYMEAIKVDRGEVNA